jgi:steroid delta-isomerase-like uncharacterized protein
LDDKRRFAWEAEVRSRHLLCGAPRNRIVVDGAKAVSLGEQWAAAWSRHDVEGLAGLFTEDCEYEDVAFDIVNRGQQGVRDWATGFLGSFPDLRVEPIRSFEHDRQGVLEWRMGGTHVGDFDGLAPTHRQWSVRGVTVLDIESGRIRRCADYWNLGAVRSQLDAADA